MRLWKIAFAILWACTLMISCNEAPSPDRVPASAPSSAGARIEKPFAIAVSGADCYMGSGKNAGDVAFGFPNRGPDAALKFTIGPLRDGFSPGQENNKPYSGPGDYPNI